MTTPTPDLPQFYGENAGPEGSEQREVYTQILAQVLQSQHANAEAINSLVRRGIQGADLVAQMTRITCLIDTLFGTLDGHPGVVNMGNSRFRLELEGLMQTRIAETLGQMQGLIEQAQQQAGQTHQRASGLIVAGRSDTASKLVNGSRPK